MWILPHEIGHASFFCLQYGNNSHFHVGNVLFKNTSRNTFLIHFHLCSTEAVSLQCVRSDCAVRHMKGSSCCVSASPPAAVNRKAFCSWCGLDKSVRMILTFREQTVPISCFSHDAFCIPCETELCSTQWNV